MPSPRSHCRSGSFGLLLGLKGADRVLRTSGKWTAGVWGVLGQWFVRWIDVDDLQYHRSRAEVAPDVYVVGTARFGDGIAGVVHAIDRTVSRIMGESPLFDRSDECAIVPMPSSTAIQYCPPGFRVISRTM